MSGKKYKVLITSAGVGDPSVNAMVQFIGGEDHGWSRPSEESPVTVSLWAELDPQYKNGTTTPPAIYIFYNSEPTPVTMPFTNPIEPPYPSTISVSIHMDPDTAEDSIVFAVSQDSDPCGNPITLEMTYQVEDNVYTGVIPDSCP